VEQKDDTVLPAATVTVLPHRQMNLRFAYSKTLNRPELRELSPFNMINWETGYEETGNAALETARIDNYDLRWELYPGPSEFVALGLFYKDFTRPITKFVRPNVGGYALAPQNGRTGTLYGWEGEVRVSLVSVWSAMDWLFELGPSPSGLRTWSFVVNYSNIHSEVDVLNSRNEWITIPFAGQSTYSLNTGLFYKRAKWEGAVLYKSFGPRLEAFGFGSLPSIYEYTAKELDLTLIYNMSPRVFLKLGAENLLNEATVFRQGGKITQEYQSGRTIGLSITNRL
jgi:outer membrane receptor protein involved in Fe transport